ncbi:hypothetical protein HDU76_004394, partial [Blyttiomyces sp. JEL0837]
MNSTTNMLSPTGNSTFSRKPIKTQPPRIRPPPTPSLILNFVGPGKGLSFDKGSFTIVLVAVISASFILGILLITLFYSRNRKNQTKPPTNHRHQQKQTRQANKDTIQTATRSLNDNLHSPRFQGDRHRDFTKVQSFGYYLGKFGDGDGAGCVSGREKELLDLYDVLVVDPFQK